MCTGRQREYVQPAHDSNEIARQLVQVERAPPRVLWPWTDDEQHTGKSDCVHLRGGAWEGAREESGKGEWEMEKGNSGYNNRGKHTSVLHRAASMKRGAQACIRETQGRCTTVTCRRRVGGCSLTAAGCCRRPRRCWQRRTQTVPQCLLGRPCRPGRPARTRGPCGTCAPRGTRRRRVRPRRGWRRG